MDSNTINAFLAVAKYCSFSQAADSLFITQPAVSKRINALEREFNLPLFNRIGRRVTLTSAGQALLPRMTALRNEMSDIHRFAANLAGEISGTLIMGTSHHIGLHRLSPVLQYFKQHYPEVKLDIRFDDSEQACNAVEQGELELAVATLPQTQPENLLLKAIWIDHLEIAVHPGHSLCEYSQVDLMTLAAYPCILPSQDTYTYRILQQALANTGVKLNIQMSTNYLETLKMLVCTGLGWSLLPHIMLDDSMRIIHTPLKLRRPLGTVIHHKRTLSNAAQAMLGTLNRFADPPKSLIN